MGLVKSRKRLSKPQSKIKKQPHSFSTKFEGKKFVIVGRSPFGSKAKKIVVNQDKSKGHVEDRRHILHYDEVIKPMAERVISALYVSQGQDKHRTAALISKRMQQRHVKRLPKNPDKLFERLVTELNSAPDNLIPDRADTNKAIEAVRGYIRKYKQQLSTPEFAADCHDDNRKRMDSYRQLARTTFPLDNSGGDITLERNRIHGEILGFIDGCTSPAELWSLLHDLEHSVTFDFSPNIQRSATVKAINWQKKMSCNDGKAPLDQLDDLMSLMD